MGRVLVVDDDGDLCDLITQWLRADGHEVLAADGGSAALAALQRHGMPDVAVLDVDMPGMDGVQLLGELRARHPQLPALFLTVLWTGPDVARMRAAGAVYLPKPCTAARLRLAVRGLMPDASGLATSEAGG